MDNTFEQFQVIARPIRKADNFWVCECRYITTDIKNGIDPEDYHAGDTTRFIANYHPELHEEGYVKYQSNMAKHRGYIGTHRVDDTYSALYKAMETQFISIGKGDSNGKLLSETIYKMDTVEKNLLKNFMEVRNRALLFGKSNVDANGKATIVDPNTNRPIYMYDGLIPQVERYASKYVYSELTVDAMQTAIGMMNQKAEKATGNKYAFICNEKAWMDVQNKLGAWLANFKPDGTFLWSKEANGYYSVGATYNSYNFGGNTITFIVDRTFSREFGNDKGYAMMIDLTADSTSGNPAVAMFTLKGGDFMYNKIAGVGGLDGLSSGVVSSTVAGSKLVNWGYASIAVFNPYRSFILRQC